MFEKSLYDLIRGLRNHKGNEREYIQHSIRECRQEIKGSDLDLKATALLKLTYLEMFGHDMSWAAFNVLEVMSSQKFVQKRVGYLGAVQSFRSDTEVMMLAENLLKKDLTSPQVQTIALPLATIPHVVNPSMANSLLSDLLPRLTHSSPNIRKKTLVTLYRLALIYPETLRPSWPKIKDRLLDEDEDPSVTAAVVNVICELGSRRPQDFLPLAPRLFDLLVAGGNNWMAIKIIKLFATLIPLEPRLVKKLLPPLTNLISTTSALSLLYECINGIISGGLLDASSGTTEGDDMARLCVTKLRSMLIPESDPNLKYVALLAYNKIVESHPYLVSVQEDVIMSCLDDADISIRLRALDLVVGMVNASNLVSIVDKLMRQLRESPLPSAATEPIDDRAPPDEIVPQADMSDEDAAQSLKARRKKGPAPLPDDYRADMVSRIIDMCAQSTYSNISDFEWYLDVQVELIKHVPDRAAALVAVAGGRDETLAQRVGGEIRNVAVRVKSSRAEAVAAANRIISIDQRDTIFGKGRRRHDAILEAAAFVVGEYAALLPDPASTLASLVQADTLWLASGCLAAFVQAALKVFSTIVLHDEQPWSPERKVTSTLLIAKVTHFLEPLTSNAGLEVQDLAVSYLELMRLAAEATKAHDPADSSSPPLVLTQAIPALFSGADLNPVAKDAQRKIPLPEDIDFEEPINADLPQLLNISAFDLDSGIDDEVERYYYERPRQKVVIESASKRLEAAYATSSYSYQQSEPPGSAEPEVLLRRKLERQAAQRDDPFYIPSRDASGTATPIGDIIRANNQDELDVDSIPILELDLSGSIPEQTGPSLSRPSSRLAKKKSSTTARRKPVEILSDETVGDESAPASAPSRAHATAAKSLLHIDSSGLGALSLDDPSGQRGKRATQFDVERRQAEEAEMSKAMKEIERLRLEMERAQERIEGGAEQVVPGRKPKKKKKKDDVPDAEGSPDAGAGVEKEKKKKKKKVAKDDAPGDTTVKADDALDGDGEKMSKKKKTKKRRQITFDGEDQSVTPA